jgi:glycosyltransferase involved in cell wall biosynthesis
MTTSAIRERSLSIVVPLHDEEDSLPELVRRLDAVVSSLSYRIEVLLVDDGSRDATPLLIAEIVRDDPRFKGIRLSRHFGHEAAITAGLDLASGDAVVVMDGDLQHPPELVPEMVARWEDGYDVVYTVRTDRRREPWLKRVSTRAYYRLLNSLSDIEIPAYVGEFRLVDRRALDAFRALRENNRYLRGMFSWVGFRQIGIQCPAVERFGGKSKYTRPRITRLAVVGLVSFSNVPLRLALYLGFGFSSIAFFLGVGAIIAKLAGAFTVPGWASILVAATFIGGVQLLVLGVIGAYVGHIYDEVKNRPLYIVGDLDGFSLPPESTARVIALGSGRKPS